MNDCVYMSLTEIKEELKSLPQSEVCYLVAYLKHLSRRGDGAYKREMDEQWESCSKDRISLKDLKRIDDQLRKSGI